MEIPRRLSAWAIAAGALGLVGAGFLAGRLAAPRVAIVRFESPFGPPQDVAVDPEANLLADEPASPKLPDPIPMGKPLRRGDVEFTVDSAEVLKIEKVDGFLMATFPADPVLIVRFSAKNVCADKRYFYRDLPEALTDDLGNHYKYIQSVPRDLKEFREYRHDPDASLDPGGTVRSSAVFEKPLAAAKELTMLIGGGVITRDPSGHEGPTPPPYLFTIPTASIGPGRGGP